MKAIAPEQNITLTRGDTHIISFKLKGENGEKYILSLDDKLYFTVKENAVKSACVLQKTIGNGISYNAETEEYEVELTSDCTCTMPYCNFVYDIELIIMRDGKKIVKTLVKGNLYIDKEVTHKENEI